jgi:hypothetical protein
MTPDFCPSNPRGRKRDMKGGYTAHCTCTSYKPLLRALHPHRIPTLRSADSSSVACPRDEMPRKSGTLASHEVLSILRCKFFLRRLSNQTQQSRFDQFVSIQVSAARKSESVPGGGA